MTEEKTAFSVEGYWEARYAGGGNSGAGSYGVLANYKTAFLNHFIVRNKIRSVVDFGCGDGNQISRLRAERYLGLDISPTAVAHCTERFKSRKGWSFEGIEQFQAGGRRFDLALSLDVVYHLVEEAVYDAYMQNLFDSATRYVLVYGSDWEAPGHVAHIRHRWFSGWVAQHRPGWRVTQRPTNPYPFDAFNDLNTTFASFAVFEPVQRERSVRRTATTAR